MLATTQASAVILSPEDAPNCPVPSLVVSQPYLAFARVSQLFEDLDRFLPGIHPSAVIAKDAIVDDSAHVGAHVVIESGVQVGRAHHHSGELFDWPRFRDWLWLSNFSQRIDLSERAARRGVHSPFWCCVGSGRFWFYPRREGAF